MHLALGRRGEAAVMFYVSGTAAADLEGAAMKQPLSRLTKVGGERRRVMVYQKPNRIWVAVGSYEGEYIERLGHRESDAVGSWRSQAARIGKGDPVPVDL
jgi:hypothetical protein